MFFFDPMYFLIMIPSLFSLAVIFRVITLSVEYNASNRARRMLQGASLVSVQELNGASAVLSAAALTCVAATLQAPAQLFYYVNDVYGYAGTQLKG